MERKERKKNRLSSYDYSQNGAYHITICTKKREPILSSIVGRAALCAPYIELSELGLVTQHYIDRIPIVYEGISVDACVIMPDHIHLLLRIDRNGAQGAARPTVDQIIRSIKIMVRKQTGISPFQRSFYEHIIRGYEDYCETWDYIHNNPIKQHNL